MGIFLPLLVLSPTRDSNPSNLRSPCLQHSSQVLLHTRHTTSIENAAKFYVLLGNIVLEQGEYDELGEEIKAPVLSDKYHIDVAWNDLESHPYGWKTYSVDLESEGMHKFGGVSYLKNKM